MQRLLLRPTGLCHPSRRFTQPRHQQLQPQPQQQQQQQQQRRRYYVFRRRLSDDPQGVTIHEGKGPTRRTFPVFELPDVVLDLDAEGSPHVRPFDQEKDVPLQESKWGYDPVVDEVQREALSMRSSMESDLNKVRNVTRLPFSARRLSDLDVMAVALMPVPTDLEFDQKSPAQKLDTTARRRLEIHRNLEFNGIPRAISKDAKKAIPFMLHQQQLTLGALKNPSKRGPAAGSNEEELNRGISHCDDLSRLKSLCSRIDSLESGVEFSSAAIGHVHARLLELLRSGDERKTLADIFKFVNNLTIKHLSTNKELNRSMTLLGLQLASELGLLSCILQYLQICLSMGFISNRAEGVNLTRSQVGDALLLALQRGEGTARGTRPQIFTLLTGRHPDLLAPQACLFGAVAEDRELSSQISTLYILLLGELGSLRLLLHHWRQRGKRADDNDAIFVTAALRCIQHLDAVKADGVIADLSTVTGDIQKDAALDWQITNIVDIFQARRGSEIPRPSSASGEASASADDIIDILNIPDMRVAMLRFQALIREAATIQQGFREDLSNA